MCGARLSCQMLRFSPLGGWIPILWNSCEVSAQSPPGVTRVEKECITVIHGSVHIVFVPVLSEAFQQLLHCVGFPPMFISLTFPPPYLRKWSWLSPWISSWTWDWLFSAPTLLEGCRSCSYWDMTECMNCWEEVSETGRRIFITDMRSTHPAFL